LVLLLVVVVALIGLILTTRLYLAGDDMSSYQQPRPEIMNQGLALSQGHMEVAELLSASPSSKPDEKTKQKEKLSKIQLMRNRMDRLGDSVIFYGTIVAVDHHGITGEWLIPTNANHQNRMLYIHGGAFLMGSSLSHRAITSRFAQIIGGPVFSLDYRLMPENKRQACIDDTCAAYRFILEQGPQGRCPLKNLYISGDSAGGNLSLVLSAWVRDNKLRPPEAVVALSPMTDSTLSSPSFSGNVTTDIMLGPLLGRIAKLPRYLLLWLSFVTSKIKPSNYNVSPLLADLSNLPPTLVHASSSEMLFDDSVRYVNKARAAGSPISFQVWQGMIHVWHIFVADMPEAEDAFKEIESFINKQSNK
jgi:acetyl esterase/lipase